MATSFREAKCELWQVYCVEEIVMEESTEL